MTRFARTDFSLKRLVGNSYKAIDRGVYETKQSFTHDTISLREAITLCIHAPLITEIKFSSPSQGRIRNKTEPAEIAKTMVDSGLHCSMAQLNIWRLLEKDSQGSPY
jgi:indole-3-glycerol phosphate synthase